jgi:cell division protein FtsN
VQVGAFANVANAERARTALSGTGEVLVDVRQSGAKALHRVRVGSWVTAAEAEVARAAVAGRGFPGAVVASLR